MSAIRFDVPRNVILPVERCLLVLDNSHHPFETRNLRAIEENWLREKDSQPALFDGKVVLLSRLTYGDGVLGGTCHLVRFATLMFWRRLGSTVEAQHIYAQAAPVTAEGALLAVRMGGHTANARKVYFASGTFEPEEFGGGNADVEGNMGREVAEETGLDLLSARPSGKLHLMWRETGVVLFRRYVFDKTAAELEAWVERFVAAEADPEIDGPVIIRGADQRIEGIQDHMPKIIDWHFSTPLDEG